MAKKIRVYELARELGLTNKEALDLALDLGIGVKSHSSSIEDAQADRVRRKTDQLGLRRDVSPDEAGAGKKAAKAGKDGNGTPASEVPAEAPAEALPSAGPVAEPPMVTPAPPTPALPVPVPLAPAASVTPLVDEPHAASRTITSRTAPRPESFAPPPPRPPETRPAIDAPAARIPARPPTGTPGAGVRPTLPTGSAPVGGPTGAPAAPGSPMPGNAGGPSGPAGLRDSGATPPRPGVRPPAGPGSRPAPPAAAPMSASGKPIPPPPAARRPPLSSTGKPIPPPPRALPSSPTGGRPGGSGGPGGPSSRPGGGGYGSPRPSGGARPGGGFSGPRPGGGFGAPRPGGGSAGAGGGFSGPRPGGAGGPGGGPPGRSGPGGGFGRGGGRPPQRRRGGRRRRNLEDLEAQELTRYTKIDAPVPEGEIVIERGSTAQDVAPKFNRTSADVVRFLLQQGEMVTATMSLSDEAIELFANEIGADVVMVEPGAAQEAELALKYFDDEEDPPESLRSRPPVITVMGHVDHGKTTLLDKIRHANVVAGEAGGITQHIGAYQVDLDGKQLTFIDTPGHEAFTAMRARGAEATDIVVLVVAADDGVMPQTREAISHAKAAGVPVVVAINRMDREDANPDRVKQQLTDQGLQPEDWGGDTIMVPISALQNRGIDELLEQLTVLAEIEDLKANPEGKPRGIVLEANLDVGRGPVATVIVENGTLRVGDFIVAGPAWGKVRALIDDKGDQVKEATPSMPVQVLGFSDVPFAGDEFRVTKDQSTARTVGEIRANAQRFREQRTTASAMGSVASGAKLEDIFEQIQAGGTATLNMILKADVQGSLEALTESLKKLERDEVKLSFVHRGVGGITENDVQLAAASNATIIGFNVRPDRKSRDLAERLDVEIRAYEIIYKVLEDIEAAMVGMLAPEYEEVITGEAEVREIFRVPRVGAIAGCLVRSGTITRGSKVRFLREGVILWKGAITSLKRFKEDVREVQSGFECGIGLNNNQDLQPGDLIETFEEREIPRT